MTTETTHRYEDILKNRLNKCKSIEEKFDKLIDIFCNQTYLLEIIIDNISREARDKIFLESGFKELVCN